MHGKTDVGKSEIVEADFERLVRALTVRPEAVPVMTEWFNQLNKSQNKIDTRMATLAEIASLTQQMKNTDKLFMDARITRAGTWSEDCRLRAQDYPIASRSQ